MDTCWSIHTDLRESCTTEQLCTIWITEQSFSLTHTHTHFWGFWDVTCPLVIFHDGWSSTYCTVNKPIIFVQWTKGQQETVTAVYVFLMMLHPFPDLEDISLFLSSKPLPVFLPAPYYGSTYILNTTESICSVHWSHSVHYHNCLLGIK